MPQAYGGIVVGRVSSFQKKEVINLSDGRRLGYVCDCDVSFETSRIEAIVVGGTTKLFGGLGKDNELVIPFSKIKRIGEDIIIVDIEERFLKRYN